MNSITSKHTQVPRSFYSLPVCRPPNGIRNKSENLGEFLTGNKIQNSPITLHMLQDEYCQILCQVTLTEKSAKTLDLAIRYEYHNNWIVDNLPSYSLGHTANGREGKHYGGGFPVGVHLKESLSSLMNSKKKAKDVKKEMRNQFKKKTMKKDKNGVSYVYNHYKIIMEYHQPDPNSYGYRIVGFGVEPMSINHQFVNGYQWDGSDPEGLKVPLVSCDKDSNKSAHHHLQIGEIHSGGQEVKSNEKILYTYDVQWKYSSTTWATRWDVYMNETNAAPKGMHWMSIVNSLFIVLLMGMFLAGILLKNLKNDISGYNSILVDEEMDEELEETGWKLIHADVFRPPQQFPMLYCVACGSGTQILLSGLSTLVFALMGLLSPARRGSLMTCVLVVYMLCGVISGYASARLYKTFRGRAWQLCTMITATLFPGLCFIFFVFFNTYTAFLHSSLSIPFLDVLLVTVMFCGVQIPLVFLGAFLGYKQAAFEYPTKISTIPRRIPAAPWYYNPYLSIAVSGVISFSAVFLELSFILDGLWTGEYYYIFGFLSAVTFVLLLVVVEVTLLLVYIQFINENHNWWWFSYACGGSIAVYLFIFSAVYFQDLQPSSMVITYLLYFGYSLLMSSALFLAMGSVASMSSFIFARKMFGAIKAD